MTNICVVDFGRIGSPLALLLAKASPRAIGVENNPSTLWKICNNDLERPNANARAWGAMET